MSEQITPRQFTASEGVQDWRLVGEGAMAYFACESFATAAKLVQEIAKIPGVEEHRPAVDLRDGSVTVRLITYTDSYFGPGTRDVEMARQIAELAKKLGLRPDTSKIQSTLIIPGAPSVSEIMPFWKAVLGYEERRDSPSEDLVDPRDRAPAFWFEKMNELRADGGGTVHLVVWLPREEVDARIKAALAAGGRIVHEDNAPSWWTLADPVGNQVDVATVGARA